MALSIIQARMPSCPELYFMSTLVGGLVYLYLHQSKTPHKLVSHKLVIDAEHANNIMGQEHCKK